MTSIHQNSIQTHLWGQWALPIWFLGTALCSCKDLVPYICYIPRNSLALYPWIPSAYLPYTYESLVLACPVFLNPRYSPILHWCNPSAHFPFTCGLKMPPPKKNGHASMPVIPALGRWIPPALAGQPHLYLEWQASSDPFPKKEKIPKRCKSSTCPWVAPLMGTHVLWTPTKKQVVLLKQKYHVYYFARVNGCGRIS